jgi:spermidine synthase
MPDGDTVLFETTTSFGHYQVVDTLYEGRSARVLFSGDHVAAQSGVPRDNRPDMLFDYNQRLFELVEQLQPTTMLMIGGGACTLPTSLTLAMPALSIDVIEQDGALVSLAERYFDLVISDRLKVIIREGREFLEANTKQYDLIIIDAFSHVHMPQGLATGQAAKAIARSVRPGGAAVVNIIAAYRGRRISPLLRMCAAFRTAFKQLTLYQANPAYSAWTAQNFMLFGQQSGTAPRLRFEAVRVPETDADDVLDDSQVEV